MPFSSFPTRERKREGLLDQHAHPPKRKILRSLSLAPSCRQLPERSKTTSSSQLTLASSRQPDPHNPKYLEATSSPQLFLGD
jgi:hypothetical protein